MFLFDDVFSVIFALMFGLFIVMFFVILINNIKQWHKNNNSPRLTVSATVTGKRQSTSHHHTGGVNGQAGMTTTDTSYYATFQFSSGDRQEFHLSSYEYAMLYEGDYGDLTFQGTRFLSFERR